jgi:ubiquinone/menaquinone biosynthesis C-methylase UbiE
MLGRPTGPLAYVLGHLWGWQHRALTTWALELMAVRPGDRVLDIGCGVGMALARLQSATGTGFAAGVDHSPTMAKQAAWRNRAAIGVGRAAVVCGDALSLPWGDGVFDQVSAMETFYYWRDPLAGLREAHRVLKPGGQLAIVMEASADVMPRRFSTRDHPAQERVRRRVGFRMYGSDEMLALARDAGFASARCETRRRGFGWLCCLAGK